MSARRELRRNLGKNEVVGVAGRKGQREDLQRRHMVRMHQQQRHRKHKGLERHSRTLRAHQRDGSGGTGLVSPRPQRNYRRKKGALINA